MTDQDKALLDWALRFIWETGVHNPISASNAIQYGAMIERLSKPVSPEAKKEEGNPDGGK